MVAANWKSADKETKDYCVEVARILKERHTELTKVGSIGCLSTINSISPGPREEAKPRNADRNTKYTDLTEFGEIFCLPEEMDSVSPGSKSDTKRRNAQLPITATHAFGVQPSQQYHGMHASMGIFPAAHGQDTMDIRDGSRTWLMEMTYQYHLDQAASIPNATTIWGNDSLNRTAINMPQPMPSGVIEETIRTASMPIMTTPGNAMGQTGIDHQDIQHQFHAIMNANRRASISNMMPLPDSAMSQTGTDHQDVQHQFHAIMNARLRASISNMMTLQGSAMSQTGTDHQDVQHQFHAIMNANRRASISNMMTLPGSAKSQTGAYHQDVQLQFHTIMNASRKASISNLMTLPGRAPMPHGIRCVGQQPSPINRRYVAPECQNPSELDRSGAKYDIQELDVADSNILDMWGSITGQEIDEFLDPSGSRSTYVFNALYGG